MTKNIYITIDDAPSRHLKDKVDFLANLQIPAIFFCRGECIHPHQQMVIEAIQKGFLIGNHSYSHPHFSKIPLEACYDEIIQTDILIDQCYHEAGVVRPAKIVRLPFGDRGAGEMARPPSTPEEREKVRAIQEFLRSQKFHRLSFDDCEDTSIDAFWTWDTQDYKSAFIDNENHFKRGLGAHWFISKRKTEVILLHDFNNNAHLFHITMDFLIKKVVRFMKVDV